MELECEQCWRNNGKGYDVITEHTVDYENRTAKCTVCGCIQHIELMD